MCAQMRHYLVFCLFVNGVCVCYCVCVSLLYGILCKAVCIIYTLEVQLSHLHQKH
jgi:hypothetical protein